MELKDFLNSINVNKQNLMDSDPKVEKLYLPFVVNKCFSYFPDTILMANQANQLAGCDKKLQYDYLLNAIRPKKRFAPWQKRIEDEKIELLKQAYKISEQKAMELMDLIDDQKLEIIRKSQFIGGHK